VQVSVRLVREADAATMAGLLVRGWTELAPWEPEREASYLTEAGQRAVLRAALDLHARGDAFPGLIVVDGAPAGRITLSTIVRGPFRSADLGYWVGVEQRRRGVATAAVAAVLRVAFDDLGLHRVAAATLLHNTGSRRVLARNGFSEIGVAPRYLQIAGRWQDHLLHQRLADDPPGADT
jgi:[ribosomal protein S5]-alanine N-acetyltransferase